MTIVSTDPNPKPIKNLNDVVITGTKSVDTFLKDVFKERGADSVVKEIIFNCAEMCVDGLGSKEVQALRKEKYDVIMLSLFFDYCYLSLVDEMKVCFSLKFILLINLFIEYIFASSQGHIKDVGNPGPILVRV